MLPVWQFHLRLFYLLNNNTYNHEIIIVYPAATLRSFVEFAFAFVSARVLLIHLPFTGTHTLGTWAETSSANITATVRNASTFLAIGICNVCTDVAIGQRYGLLYTTNRYT